MNNKKNRLIIGICAGLLILITFIASLITKKTDVSDKTGMDEINDNWNYIISIKIKNSNSIATYYDNSKSNVYILAATHNITEDMRGKTLSFKTEDSYVDVYISENINASDENTDIFSKDNSYNLTDRVYHFGKKPIVGDSPGSSVHFIEIPEDAKGSITIRIETSYKNSFLKNYTFGLGAKKDLIHKYISSEIYTIVSGCVLFIFGLIVLAFFAAGRLKNKNVSGYCFIGILSVVTSLYFLTSLSVSTYMIKNPVGQYYIRDIAVLILPILILGYLDKFVKMFKVERYIIVALIVALTLLHLLGIATYLRTVKMYVACIMLIMIVVMVRGVKKLKLVAEKLEQEDIDDIEDTDDIGDIKDADDTGDIKDAEVIEDLKEGE
ncbi:MAG: hypothetical protein J6P57_07875 [Lachnospiraceae bacterium]|nr:hypothetical protein [Lachnospiraceae bacterium]